MPKKKITKREAKRLAGLASAAAAAFGAMGGSARRNHPDKIALARKAGLASAAARARLRAQQEANKTTTWSTFNPEQNGN